MEIGVDPEMVSAVVKEVRSACSLPVFAKLTPNTHRLMDVAKAVEAAGGDAVVAINTVKAMAISAEIRRPILSNKGGGLSGPAIKPIGLRCVYDLHAEVNIPIIGVGGVENWRDAVEYIMAGASAVQVGSGVGRVGLEVFESICTGMRAFMEREGFATVNQMVGVAHE
jgi:dihydroorotate dehydrogenase (NAD+) catalytic subunit